MATDMKTCTTCGTTKLLDEFHNKKATKDGKNPQCKMCVKACNKKWALTHPRNTKSAYTKWRKSHRDYIAAFKRADRIKNIERELAAEAGRRERYNLNHPRGERCLFKNVEERQRR